MTVDFDPHAVLGYTVTVYTPTLDLLRNAISAGIVGFQDRLIKTGAVPTRVHRLHLEYEAQAVGPLSAILKVAAPDWPADPPGPDRERRFYACLLPQLDVAHPRIYYTGVEGETGCRILLLEDLAPTHYCPLPLHAWTPAEMHRLLRAYARLHIAGCDALPPQGERGWMWRPLLQRRDWTADQILARFQALVEWEIWSPLRAIERLIAETLAQMPHFGASPVTLLHNDVYPPNIALPRKTDDPSPAILLDWEMAGWGLAEMDLAFLFMQPYHSTRQVSRPKVLDYYWRQRLRLEGHIPPPDERRARQHHADALWALSLLLRAYDVASQPFPPGSPAAHYWASMFCVVYQRLRDLCGGTL